MGVLDAGGDCRRGSGSFGGKCHQYLLLCNLYWLL